MATTVQLQVLGPLEASLATPDGPQTLDLGGPRQRAVVALLAVARGDVVSVDRLIDDLWRGEPPAKAIGGLQAYVSNLRRTLEPDRRPRTPATVLVSKAPGYALRLPADAVDAWRFEAMLRDAGAQPDPHEARATLEAALALWRGPAYAEFSAAEWAVPEAARLDGMRVVARERLAAAMVGSGSPEDAVPLAEALTADEPMREEGWRLLATAQYHAGRQAGALATLRRARAVLAEELGLDPGPALAALEADVLAQRLPAPSGTASSPASHPGPATVVARAPQVAVPPPDKAFVGRDVELNVLHQLAQQRHQPPGGVAVALVTGDPGDGKSALLRRFLGELGQDGWRVAVGRCPEVDGAPPAWAWVEVLRGLSAQVDLGAESRVLAALLDDTSSAPTAVDPAYQSFQLHQAVGAYLQRASTDRPLVVALDDLHRADDQTLSLLSSVAERSVPGHLLLVAAYRGGEVEPPLQDALARLAELAPTRLRLQGLDATQAARLVRAVAGIQPSDATVAALTERTGGNPFYLAESARLLGSEGDLVALSAVPEGVRDVLRRRFARLPQDTLAVLRLAAVVGRYVDVDVLVRSAADEGHEEDAVVDALDSGLVAGLLEEPSPDVLRFSHALVRDTLYGDVPALRRRRWHARVGRALETVRPNDVAALAHHFAQVGPSGAHQALRYHSAAAHQAEARFARDVAADHYAQALAAMDVVDAGAGATPDAGSRVTLLVGRYRAQVAAGANAAAATTRAEALEVATHADRGDLLTAILTALYVPTPWINRPYGIVDEELVAHIERALAVPGQDDETRIRLLCALIGEIGGELDHYERRTRDAAAEALLLARGHDDAALLGMALHAHSMVTLPDTDGDERLAQSEELIELGQREGLAVYALLGHHSVYQVACARLDLVTANVHLEQAHELAERYRWGQARGQSLVSRGFQAHLRGDLEDAERLYVAGGSVIAASGNVNPQGILGIAIFTLRLTQGRIAELEQLVATAGEGADPTAIEDFIALLRIAQNRPDDARIARRFKPPVRRDFFHSLMLSLRGRVLVALGESAEARKVYDDLLPYRGQVAGGGTGSYAAGPVDLVLGDLATLLGRTGNAETHYESALDVARRCGNGAWVADARSRL